LIVAIFDGSVHSLGLAIGLRIIWLGQLVFDPIVIADAIEDVRSEIPSGWSVPVFWQNGSPLCPCYFISTTITAATFRFILCILAVS
jgi:hypothetical protein